MSVPSLLEQLIQGLRCLPGVGQKSAQRMAFHLLERDRNGGRVLAQVLAEAMQRIGHCQRCRDFCERSEEHTSELQSLMLISYAVFCLKKNTHHCLFNYLQNTAAFYS